MSAAVNHKIRQLDDLARAFEQQAARAVNPVQRGILDAAVEVLREQLARLQDTSFQRWLQHVETAPGDGGTP
jgi:hypothetical protein